MFLDSSQRTQQWRVKSWLEGTSPNLIKKAATCVIDQQNPGFKKIFKSLNTVVHPGISTEGGIPKSQFFFACFACYYYDAANCTPRTLKGASVSQKSLFPFCKNCIGFNWLNWRKTDPKKFWIECESAPSWPQIIHLIKA